MAKLSALFLVAGLSAMTSAQADPYQYPFDTQANLTEYAQPITPYDFPIDGPPLELVHELYGDFPTGIAVDKDNRIFFNIPRSQGETPLTVSLATSFTTEEPWPNQEIQKCGPHQNKSTCFVNVQNVVIDSTEERIWIVDTGLPPGGEVPVKYGAKIWAFNLTSRKPLRNYVLPPSLTSPGISINDVRFNLSLSKAGVGFISDEENSLLTLDLHTGVFKQLLKNTEPTTADRKFAGSFDGVPWYQWEGEKRTHIDIGADGIALTGGYLYFSPLASRRLYRIPQEDMLDSSLSAKELLQKVSFIGQIGSYTQGMASDTKGKVYVGTAEQNSVTYFNTTLQSLDSETVINGLRPGMKGIIPANDIQFLPFVRSAYIQWPDSICIANKYLWITINQLPLSPLFQRNNIDRRQKPWKIYRAYIGAERAS